MKKNIMMRLSAILLVAVLLTTCVISGTWAKYVTTSDKAVDSATVAKWGILMTVTGDDAVYNDETLAIKDAETLKVKTDALCAPGTYEKLTTFTLTGTPEVAYKISVVVDLKLTNWKVAGVDYCPLVFTVAGAEYKIEGDITSVAELEEAVENAIKVAIAGDASGVKSYNAGVAVPTTANSVLVDWTWAFEGDNAKDTVLGDAANATIGFELQVTVTQED